MSKPTDWQAEADRLRACIRAWLGGDAATMTRHTIFRADGVPSKHDLCEHGQAMWQGCEACSEAYFERVIAEQPS